MGDEAIVPEGWWHSCARNQRTKHLGGYERAVCLHNRFSIARHAQGTCVHVPIGVSMGIWCRVEDDFENRFPQFQTRFNATRVLFRTLKSVVPGALKGHSFYVLNLEEIKCLVWPPKNGLSSRQIEEQLLFFYLSFLFRGAGGILK